MHKLSKFTSMFSITTSLALTLGSSGCAPGRVNVAVVAVHPWEDMLTPLSPNFKLDAEGALGQVLPVTQRVRSQTRSGSAADVEVSVLNLGELGDAKPTPDDATGSDMTPQLRLERLEDALENDPFLAYASATALFQEVEMLERYLGAATMKRGHVPYLVRLQIVVEPYRKAAPWDAYVDIDFKSSANSAPVEVVPLVGSLNMESTARSIDQSQLWSMAFGIQALGPVVGVNAKKQRQLERAVQRLTQDLNSVSLVSRNGPGQVSVKLGARNTGNGSRRQTAQVHSIAVLVLVPKDAASKPGASAKDEHQDMQIASLEMSVSVVGRNIHTGARLDGFETSADMSIALPPFSGAYVSPTVCPREKGDAPRYYECKHKEHLTLTTTDKQTTAVVPGIQGANAKEMSAVLVATKGDSIIEIRATSVDVDAGRRLSTFSFPSLADYFGKELSELELDLASGWDLDLYVYHRGSTWWSGVAQDSFPMKFSEVDVQVVVNPPANTAPPAAAPKPAPKLRVEPAIIQRDPEGRGSIALNFIDPRTPDQTQSLVPLEVQVIGCGIASTPTQPIAQDKKGRLVVSEPGRVVLSLINLAQDDVIIRTRELADKGEGPIREEIRLSVNPK